MKFRSRAGSLARSFSVLLILLLALIPLAVLPTPARAVTCGAGSEVGGLCRVFLTSGTSWTVPDDWNSSNNTIEVIGGGGGGGNGGGSSSGSGGGAGAYSKISNASLTAGSTVQIKVGAGGSAASAGEDTYLCNSTSNCESISGSAVIVGAKAGGAGVSNSAGAAGGAGGASSSGVGSVRSSGGSGGGSNGGRGGGGGGGAAGPLGAGQNGGQDTNASCPIPGGGGGGSGGGSAGSNGGSTNAAGGAGGNNDAGAGGGAGGATGANGTAGSNPSGVSHGAGGGGGGGGRPNGSGNAGVGGAGGAGQEWDSTHGSGAGGGGGGQGTCGGSGSAPSGGNAGLYGGGGGGAGFWGAGTAFGGSGAQGIIAITYTPTKIIRINSNINIASNFDVRGSISKGSGTFVIDHPLRPRTHLLYHSFVESPDAKNVYDGVAQLDESGEVVIQLPEYFQALNESFRYQYFPHYQPMPGLHIKQEVRDNRFIIGGGAPYGEVSWQITGNRKDPYIQANPIRVEVEKGPDQPVDKGEFVFPDYPL